MRRRLNKVNTEWSPALAYAIGLIVTDGNLSKSERHINLTSKDLGQIKVFKKCLSLNNKVGKKARGGSLEKKYFVIQFGDINFYNFLLSIGLMQRKSKIIGKIDVPDKYFADFLRGCIDGDGNISIVDHPESRHKQLRIRLTSASIDFSQWVIKEIRRIVKCKGGWIYSAKKKTVHSVTFAKEDSIKIIKFMYYDGVEYYLSRKRNLIKEYMGK